MLVYTTKHYTTAIGYGKEMSFLTFKQASFLLILGYLSGDIGRGLNQ